MCNVDGTKNAQTEKRKVGTGWRWHVGTTCQHIPSKQRLRRVMRTQLQGVHNTWSCSLFKLFRRSTLFSYPDSTTGCHHLLFKLIPTPYHLRVVFASFSVDVCKLHIVQSPPCVRRYLSARSKFLSEGVRKFCEKVTEGRERTAVAEQDVDVRNFHLSF